MSGYKFKDRYGTFHIDNPEQTGYLYFPLAGEQGIKSAITPTLGGDCKLDQNHFLLQPVSAEDLHNNKSTRNFWCDIKGKGIWSATGVSSHNMSKRFDSMDEEKEVTELEAGILWHKMKRTSKEFSLSSEILSFVPVSEEQVEIMSVTIRNIGTIPCEITPIAAIPIYGRSADNLRDHRHVTSLLHRIATKDESIIVKPTLSFDERGHQVNEMSYYVSGVTGECEKPMGFYPIVEDYIGEGGSFECPEAVFRKKYCILKGMEFEGYEAMGGIRFKDIALAPGESKEFVILLGMGQDENSYKQALNSFGTSDKVKKALDVQQKHWKKRLNVSYRTGDSEFDNFMYWVSFQPILRRIYGCSFLPHHDYGKGGRGWRDLWQDCLALLMMNPEGVKEMLLDNFGGVRMDGTNATIIGSKQGEFVADRNNITRVWMDHGLWPLITTALYIEQTGDVSVLLEEKSYFKDKQVCRGTKIDDNFLNQGEPIQKDLKGNIYYGTILEHILVQTLTCFYEVGEHNHMRIRGADWNDALDMANERGESVAFTAAYAGNLFTLARLLKCLLKDYGMENVLVAKEMELLFTDQSTLYKSIRMKKSLLDSYCESCKHTISGEKVRIKTELVIAGLENKAMWLQEHIRKTEWIQVDESGWFNSYYDNHGQQVEGKTEHGIRMMLTGQVFTIMSGTATEEQVGEIVASADKYLYKEDVGGYRLNTNFHEMKTDLGRMFGFAYGHKENGAVFSHMTTMYANALYNRGFAKEGYKALNALYKQSINFNKSKIYPGIPEYFNDRGRGMYHYLTGAASWYMLTVITQIFGVKGSLGALSIMPRLMAKQFDAEGRAEISLPFGERLFNIVYVNETHKEYGEYRIGDVYLDGNRINLQENNILLQKEQIELLDKESEHQIIVWLI
ncbi:GH36-type glycosyl hydrolase domain-containing protein [Clostridium sp. Marseille-P299]|uniref:GH36-type glycosyl hydrolase domain-containing protein n=1 Tax=Clostridium sp. Marseille-P299 TaxID=1805477 RepID=UPI00082A2C3C|nr:cellobiose phosphorylase [Clostridium sp. Marseille-P299]